MSATHPLASPAMNLDLESQMAHAASNGFISRRAFVVTSASALAFASQPVEAKAAPTSAAELGTYQAAGCTGRDRLPAFEKWLGRKVDRVLDGLAPQGWTQMVATTSWVAGCWQREGVKLTLTIPMLPRDGSSTLAQGAEGAYDKHFTGIAKVLVDKGFPEAIIRIGPEFNAKWFPWTALKQPDLWVAYWRKAVIAMRSVPGQQFKFDWCPILGLGVASPETAYPGDEYVDIIGGDFYNANFHPSKVSQPQLWGLMLAAPFGLKWHQRFAAEHGKPMSYPEWGTGTRPDGFGGGDDPLFIRNMAEWIHTNNVLYHVYWDYPASDFNAKLSDGSKPQAGAAFLKAFGGAR